MAEQEGKRVVSALFTVKHERGGLLERLAPQVLKEMANGLSSGDVILPEAFVCCGVHQYELPERFVRGGYLVRNPEGEGWVRTSKQPAPWEIGGESGNGQASKARRTPPPSRFKWGTCKVCKKMSTWRALCDIHRKEFASWRKTKGYANHVTSDQVAEFVTEKLAQE